MRIIVIKWKSIFNQSHRYHNNKISCPKKLIIIYFAGFGYPTTHDGLGSLPSAFIERVARKLGDKGRSADSAILPFLCYTFVPKCRINGDVSNIRPCRDACDKLEVSVTKCHKLSQCHKCYNDLHCSVAMKRISSWSLIVLSNAQMIYQKISAISA